MKKTLKTFIVTCAVALGFGLSASAVQVLTFSGVNAEGDCYADGSPLLAGECYAVVWQRYGVDFQGFNADGTLVDTENSAFFTVLHGSGRGAAIGDRAGVPYAYCPTYSSQVSSGTVSKYSDYAPVLYALDTRVWSAGVASLAKINADGRPSNINSYVKIRDLWLQSDMGMTPPSPLEYTAANRTTVSSVKTEKLVFRTVGDDCFVEGAETNSVATGECYALVWKRTGVEAPELSFEPAAPAAELKGGEDYWLAGYYPAATNDGTKAWCRDVTIEAGTLPFALATNGTWTVYLLDTRDPLAEDACGFDPAVTNAPKLIRAYAPVAGLTDFTLALTDKEDVFADKTATAAAVADRQTEKPTLEITCLGNGGTPASQTIERTWGEPYGDLSETVATRAGYGFAGWADGDGQPIDAAAPVWSEATLFAQWNANNYSVAFDANGGEGEMKDQEFTYGEPQALADNLFTRTGYGFAGWATEEKGEALYLDKAVVSNLTAEADGEFPLYAVWAANHYYVAFNANGGEGEMERQEFTYDQPQALTQNAFTMKGYRFDGWATSKDGDVVYRNGESVVGLTGEAGGLVELFACWTTISTPSFILGSAVEIDAAELLGVDLTGYSAKNLPTGLSFKNGKITGTAKAATPVDGQEVSFEKKNAPTYALSVVVLGLPTWAMGDFAGMVTCADGSHGTASFKVETSGKISNGKLLVAGTNWTFSAASYDGVIDDVDAATGADVETYVIVAEAADTKKNKRTVRLDVTRQASPDVAADAALAVGSFGSVDEKGEWIEDEGSSFELWRNVWKDADASAVLAGVGGKYTWLYSNEVDDVTVPLTLDAKSAALKGTAKLSARKNASVTFQTTAYASTNGIEAAFFVAADKAKGYAEIFECVEVLPFAGVPAVGVTHRDPGVIAVPAMDGDGALGTSKATVTPAGGQVAAGKTVTLKATADAKNVFYRWEYVVEDGTEAEPVYDDHDTLTLTMDGTNDVSATAWFRSKAACTNAPTVTLGEAAADAFAKMTVGVAFKAQVDVPEAAKPVEFSAKNLPTGLAIDKVTGVVSGVPTANAKGAIEIIATSKADKKLFASWTNEVVAAAEALPGWAVGDFAGTVTCADGTHGTVSMKVDAKGAVSSGKLLEHGTNWTFSAKSYDGSSETRGDRKYVVIAEAKSGKETRLLHLNVVAADSLGVAANAALAAGWFAGTSADVELWRNVWKDADAKAKLAANAGKYTYFFGHEGQDVTLPLDLNASSAELKGSAVLAARGNKKVDFKTTVFAGTNGVEATFYVAADAKLGYGEICERFRLAPESGLREDGVAHHAPRVDATAVAYAAEDVTKCKAAVSPTGGQVDAGKSVTLTASPDQKCVFVRWECERGGVAFTNENAMFSLTMDGERDVTANAVFRDKTSFSKPVVTVDEDEKAKFAAMELGVFFSAKVSVTDSENMKPVKFTAANLPTGLKIDQTTGEISGIPTAAGRGAVTVTATSVANGSKSETFTFDFAATPAALPWTAVGTFSGFVVNGSDNRGTLTFTCSEVGKLSAKVTDAGGTYSFSGAGWASSEDGVYAVTLTTSKGEELTLALDANAAWNENQLTGTFGTFDVLAQRCAFGAPWNFCCAGDEDAGWTLAYTNVAKGAPLSVTLKLDGTTAIAGSLTGKADSKGKSTTYKVSASGYANVSLMTNGAFVADFAPVLTVDGKKRVLSIHTKLWMDRSNEHATDGSGIGTAKFIE